MTHDEAYWKSQLARRYQALFPGDVWLRHEDVRTAGVPDISITGGGRTLWVEGKMAMADGISFKARGVQMRTCDRLAKAGLCALVLWGASESWWVVDPRTAEQIGTNRFTIAPAVRSIGQWTADLAVVLHSMLHDTF